MNKIIALWATPRSTSTVFEKIMANRGDMHCLHEPYNEAYYYGADRRHNRYYNDDSELMVKPDLTFAQVHKNLLHLATDKRLFIKDFAYSITHLADDGFLSAFIHTFLIRHPEKVITSLYARYPDLILPEIGFAELHTLYNRIADQSDRAPVIIDSDELLAAPEAGMKAYCNALNIPYLKHAMQWQKSQKNPTWNDDKQGFHDALKNSTRLKPQQRNYPPLASSTNMLRLYEASLPHYQALYNKRLRFT